MSQSFGQNWQDVNDAALGPIGSAAREANSSIMARLSQHMDSPLRMFATFPTADAKINFAANRVVAGDNTSKSTPAVDDLISSFVASTIDLQSGATTGGTFYRSGVAFTMPTVVSGNFYRVAFMYRGDNIIDCKFSPDGYASYAAMAAATDANPGTLFAALDGVPIGWIDLVATSTTAFKTASSAGSSATNIIENAVSGVSTIFRISAGGGAGGGADRTYKLGSFSATGATMKGGYAYLDDGRVISSGVGATSLLTGIDQIINLNNVLTASSLAAIGTINSGAAKLLALVLDLTTLGAVAELTDNKRKVFQFAEANLKFIDQADLTLIDPRRYVLLDQVHLPITVSSWATAFGIVKPTRVHDSMAAYFPYVQRYASPNQTTASASIPLTHGLDAEPQMVQVFYYDGTKKIDITTDALIGKTATQVLISTLGLTFGGGQYAYVEALYVPTTPNVASASRTYTSPWYENTATTTVPHGLSDMEDIRGLQVQEWDVTAAKRRVMDNSSLIVNFDAVNVYLNWTGLTPSSTLKYRFFVGGSPIPWSIRDGGFDTITDASGAGAPDFPNGATGIETGINGNPIVYELTKQAIGAVGSTGQKRAGHLLSSKSWPSALGAANVSWFNFDVDDGATILDDSGNGRSLTKNGSAVFTGGTNILGATNAAAVFDGVDDSYSSTDAFFDPGDVDFCFGGWFFVNDFTTGADQALIGQWNTTANERLAKISIDTGNSSLNFQLSPDGTSGASTTVTIPVSNFTDGTWIHVALRHDAAANMFHAYVNGKFTGSAAAAAANTAGVGNRAFRIGAQSSAAASFFSGRAGACFFAVGSLTDEDVHKIYSYRLDHNSGVAVGDQKWSANMYGASTTDEGQTPTTWMVDKYDTNSLFIDLSDRASTDQVELFMENRASSPTTVGSVVPYDVIHSVNPTFPIAHGQTGVPELVAEGELTTGVWEPLTLTGQVSADSTNFVAGSSLASFFSGGYLRVRLVARNVGPVQTGVPLATTGLDGLIGSRAKGHQKMGGLKGWIDGAYSVGNLRDPEGAGTTTLSDDDRRHQTFNLTAARTVVLPSTSVLKGDEWVIENRAAFDLTVQASNATEVTVGNGANDDASIQRGRVVLVALQDAPTSPAHWRVSDVEDYWSGSLQIAGGYSASPALATGHLVRRGRLVNFRFPSTQGTSNATTNPSISFGSGANQIPSRFAPVVQQFFSGAATVVDSGVVTAAGSLSASVTSVTISKNLNGASGSFTASGSKGFYDTQVTWAKT